MQFEEDRIYSAVEIADFRNTLIEKYDYKIFRLEEQLKKAYNLGLSKFRQHPDTSMEIVLQDAHGQRTVLHPAVPVFGKDRIRNGADKLVAACADTVLGVLFDKLPGDEGYLYSDKEIVWISLFARMTSPPQPLAALTATTKKGVVTGLQYTLPYAPNSIAQTLAAAI